MRLMMRDEIEELRARGSLSIEGADGHLWLDGLRLAVRLAPEILWHEGPLLLRDEPDAADGSGWQKGPLAGATLRPGVAYLARSVERLQLPADVVGIIQTRSKFARQGLDVLGSSSFVTAGFGAAGAAPLALELRAACPLGGLVPGGAYGYLLLFALDAVLEEQPPRRRDHDRFPFVGDGLR